MRSEKLKLIGKRVLQFGLPIVILAIIFSYIRRDWSELTRYTFEWNPWLIALSFAGFVLQVISYGFIWRAVLARLGSHLNVQTALRVYLASEFVRYIPGGVWHVLTRIIWVGKYGVPRPIAFASMTIELITKLAAGALVFAVSLLFWGDLGAVSSLLYGTPIITGIGAVTIVGLLVVLHPKVLNWLLNFALRLLKRDPVTLTLRYLDILLVTLAWSVSWCVAGGAFYMLLIGVWPGVSLAALPICIGIYALVWDIGFLAILTPSGLGFREAAMVALLKLALPLPLGVAAVMALLSRLVSTLAELLCVSVAYVGGARQVRAVQQEQADKAVVGGDGVGEKKIDEAKSSEQVGIEGGARSD